MDVYTLFDSSEPGWSRALAAGSLLLSVATLGASMNYGAFSRAGRAAQNMCFVAGTLILVVPAHAVCEADALCSIDSAPLMSVDAGASCTYDDLGAELVPIEAVQVGDRVWSMGDDGEPVLAVVTRTFVSQADALIDLTFVADGSFVTNGPGSIATAEVVQQVEVTTEHPFLTAVPTASGAGAVSD